MAEDLEKAKKRLRQYLNPAIQGPNTEAILDALSTGACHLIDNAEAVYDQLYIVTADERYLDQRMADRNITRPDNVGLSDEVFREIGIEISNRKQVRDLIMNILRIMYGVEFTRATMNSSELETYLLLDGDTLIIQYDDQDPLEITFETDQFTNINTATAQEVADAITRGIRNLGKTGSAVVKDDGLGPFVQLISETDGPSSTVKVLGGRAQNVLRFEEIRLTTGLSTTQWTLEVTPGGTIKATWTGGPDPSIGRIQVGDYVNIYGSAFDPSNRGTYTIIDVQGGLSGDAFVEFENPNGISEVTLQGTDDAILFFDPVRNSVIKKINYALAFQTESRLLEVFMPATTKVVRRERKGAAHLHDVGPSAVDEEAPYIFDTSKPYTIAQEEAATTVEVDSNTVLIVNVDDASDIPDEPGNLVFGFGTSREEGPVPYIARPSSNTLTIDPSYEFTEVHPSGTNISLISQDFAYDVRSDGTDFPFYITDIVSGRIYAEDLIKLVAAAGINVVITILYPNDIGLGKYGNNTLSEKRYVWGEDPSGPLFEIE